MIIENDSIILYIEPYDKSDDPVVDSLTIKMFNALKAHTATGYVNHNGQFTPNIHTCRCGKNSKSYDYQLKSGQATNSLCVHYLAYHRKDVPENELSKVSLLNSSEVLDENDQDRFNQVL